MENVKLVAILFAVVALAGFVAFTATGPVSVQCDPLDPSCGPQYGEAKLCDPLDPSCGPQNQCSVPPC